MNAVVGSLNVEFTGCDGSFPSSSSATYIVSRVELGIIKKSLHRVEKY